MGKRKDGRGERVKGRKGRVVMEKEEEEEKTKVCMEIIEGFRFSSFR